MCKQTLGTHTRTQIDIYTDVDKVRQSGSVINEERHRRKADETSATHTRLSPQPHSRQGDSLPPPLLYLHVTGECSQGVDGQNVGWLIATVKLIQLDPSKPRPEAPSRHRSVHDMQICAAYGGGRQDKLTTTRNKKTTEQL